MVPPAGGRESCEAQASGPAFLPKTPLLSVGNSLWEATRSRPSDARPRRATTSRTPVRKSPPPLDSARNTAEAPNSGTTFNFAGYHAQVVRNPDASAGRRRTSWGTALPPGRLMARATRRTGRPPPAPDPEGAGPIRGCRTAGRIWGSRRNPPRAYRGGKETEKRRSLLPSLHSSLLLPHGRFRPPAPHPDPRRGGAARGATRRTQGRSPEGGGRGGGASGAEAWGLGAS